MARAFVNGKLVDPSQDLNAPCTLLEENGRVLAVETDIDTKTLSDRFEIIDCRDKVIMPGIVDAQVRTGEPGTEHEETLQSASLAAVAGGVTTMVTQPNTEPVLDDIALIDFIQRNAGATAVNKVRVMGALTKGLKGQEMSELRLMHEAGAVAFTNCKSPITNARIMRRALSYACDFDGLIVHHPEEPSLTEGGVMNEGESGTRLGLPGIPKMAEIIMLERDIRLAELTGGRYHAASISCAESVEIVRRAKARGVNITCGVSVNNLALNENDIGAYRTFFKLNPPLRHEDDRQAIIDGIRDRTIDIVHSDHTPRDVDEKRHPFQDASDGAIGLETFAAAMLRLVNDDAISLDDMARTLCQNPAHLLGLSAGSIAPGLPADMVIIDPDEPWILTEETIQSRSKNTSFEGAKFLGRVVATYIDGMEVYRTEQ